MIIISSTLSQIDELEDMLVNYAFVSVVSGKTKVAAQRGTVNACMSVIAIVESNANPFTKREGHETDLHALPCSEKCCHFHYET